MCRMLIADDEREERKAVIFLLNQCPFPLEIEEAENGQDALDKLSKNEADILLTDVRMPFLLGTELASRARELYKDLQIIFFSGYNDFPYVKKALTLGAVDYILKPINPEELKKVVSCAIQRLQAQKRTAKQEQLATVYLRNHLLSRLLYGADLESFDREFKENDPRFPEELERFFLLQFDDPVFGGIDQDLLEKAVAKALNGRPYHFLNLNTYQSVVFLRKGGGPYLSAGMTAKALQEQISSCCGKPCYLSISDALTGAASIAAAYARAEQALDDRFFFKNCYIYPISDDNPSEPINSEEDDTILRSVSDAIQFKDTYSLQKSVHMILTKYSDKRNQSKINVSYIFSQLVGILYRALPSEKNGLQDLLERLYSCQYFEDIKSIVSDILARVVQQLDTGMEPTGHAIKMIKKYIQEHYNEELSLTRLAELFYLSPHYLSDLFIRETGYGINKYIKTIRMERARDRILNTNEKIQDICKDIGYPNFSYFCRSFRETFGQTPESFRHSSF